MIEAAAYKIPVLHKASFHCAKFNDHTSEQDYFEDFIEHTYHHKHRFHCFDFVFRNDGSGEWA
jgi:hypothetical protein